MGLYKQAPAKPKIKVIGNQTVGIIEVPLLGGLTIEEDETIAEVIDGADDVVVLAAQKAQAIALAEEITDVEAYRVIEDSVFFRDLEEKAKGIAIRHAEAIGLVRTAYKLMGTLRRKATVTALLKHRLGQTGIPEGFPRVLFDALATIAEEEAAAERMPSEPMTAEALGKPPEATRARKRPTGQKDTGS